MTADRFEHDEELAALLAVDALELDEHADAEERTGGFPSGWAETVAALATTVADEPPSSLRAATLRRARGRRAPGMAIGAPVPCSPIEAYRGAVDQLHGLLVHLGQRDWDAAAHPDHGSVREVVAHLVGVEELSLGWVGARPAADATTPADHVESTRPVIEELAGVAPAEIVERWYGLARDVEAACRVADPRRSFIAHDLPTDVEGLLVLRSFELWAHAHDVTAAIGQASPDPDPTRLALMSTRLVAALPFALALRHASIPGRTARVVLTGAAPGCYDVALDPAASPGDPDVTIIADAVELCRVAARRLPAADLEVTVEGDDDSTELAGVLLGAVDAFARD